MRRFLVALLLFVCGVLPLAVQQHWIYPPPRWDPWAPLNIAAQPNLLTSFKLWRLKKDPELCRQALDSSTLQYTALADSVPQANCPLENTVRVEGSEVHLNNSFIATCPLAAAFAMFEQHGLQPAAQALFGQPVVRLEHVGSYACRAIAGSRRQSQHASANALDIVGFRLRDGRPNSVLRQWPNQGVDATILRRVHHAACASFHTTLGPDYNAAHHDHFHIDMGLFRMCR